MKTITIHYYAANGGDGSAYPVFFTTAELAEWASEQESEGFCDATGSFDILVPEGVEIEIPSAKNEVQYLLEVLERQSSDLLKKYIAKFFAEGIPMFTVKVESCSVRGYRNNIVFADGVKIGKYFETKAESGQKLADRLNALGK